MISEIATQLTNTFLSSVQYADKVAGLVTPMKKMVNKVEKTFPVAINTPTTCNMSVFTDLVPDSSKKSIIYCEKVGEMLMESLNINFWIVNARLRLICWYNLDLINEGNYVDEGVVADNLLSQIPRSLPNSSFTYVSNVRLYPQSVISGAEIFSKYTYDEVKDQYITHPYGAFAINIDVQYVLNKCAETLLTSPKCGNTGYVAPVPDIVEFIPS